MRDVLGRCLRQSRRHGQQFAATAGVMFAPGILLDAQPYAFGRLSEKALRRDLLRRAHRTEPLTTPEGK